ncbi:MAG: ubiquinol-cytochrome C chaperone [Bauldia sp.]|nr:MAG: ubiquinol-cytochrome C chaperone [Bauldia sp.]
MFDRFFRRGRRGEGIPAALYGAIVAQARSAALYRDFGVPDTVEGRFEMVVLHLALVLRHLRDGDGHVSAVGQSVFDTFCTEMDRSLREMGVGDLSVGKKMRQVGEAFYGRAAAYESALSGRDASDLASALTRNVYAGAVPGMAVTSLAAYIFGADEALARGAAGLREGAVRFPEPESFVPAEARP